MYGEKKTQRLQCLTNMTINPRPPRLANENHYDISYKTFMANIGKLIKGYREQAHVTQRELGADIHKTVTHISAVENGRRGLSLHSLFHVAQTLRIDLSQLIKESLQND